MALITEGYYRSYRCVQELKQALDSRDKLVVLVSLDNKVSVSGPKEGVCVKQHGDESEVIEISREALDEVVRRQQISLKNNVIDGVLQSTFADQFERLAQIHEAFNSTRDAKR